MRFTTRHMLNVYLAQQPLRMQQRMHTIVTKVWNSVTQNWEEVFDVVLGPPVTRKRRKKTGKKSQDFSKKSAKASLRWVP